MFLYEMHQHTAGCSACGIDNPEKTVRELKAAGFAGMVLTNHFYHGNTGIPRSLPWQEFVRRYEDGFLQAKSTAEPLDFDVLFGLEEGIGAGREVLLYGITPDFLYSHPELRDADLPLISRLVRDAGGLVFQAHPFRVRSYIPRPFEELDPRYLDGVEVWNACNGDLENVRAEIYAKKNRLLPCAGSDAHTGIFPRRAGIACAHRITDEQMLADTLRQQSYVLHLGD